MVRTRFLLLALLLMLGMLAACTDSSTTGAGGSYAGGGGSGAGGSNAGSAGADSGAGGQSGNSGTGGGTAGSDSAGTAGSSAGAGGGAGTQGGESGSAGSSGSGGGADEPCPPYPDAKGAIVTVTPGQAGELANIVANAAADSTIALEDGTYDLSASTLLHFTTAGVTLRSVSGNRDAVILDAGYAIGEIALIAADNVTLADLTLQRATWHPIHVTGRSDANITGTLLYNVRVIDPGQQGIKINPSPEGFYVDQGTVACSRVELTDVGKSHVTDCYTGGIDAHSAWGWVVRDNSFEGFWCDAGLSEHAVHFWVTARDTLVERNVIVDCARGIGFGLGEGGNGKTRVYPDVPCPGASYVGHVDGMIRNNFVVGARPELFASGSGFDSGIALEQACGTQVYHNSVAALEPPFTSIEYRWANTKVILKNNLVTHAIKARDDASAELDANLADAALSNFVDAASGDLHLTPESTAIDQGAALAPGTADQDFDRESRGTAPDVGADEVP